MHILSPETDNCPSWISGRESMTVENISWSISTKECCRPRRGLNPQPTGLQLDGASNWATKAGYILLWTSGKFRCIVSLFLQKNQDFINPKMPGKLASENVVCLCHLLNILSNFSNLFLHTGKQCEPWSDCSEQSDLGPHCLQKWLKNHKQMTIVVIGSLRIKKQCLVVILW